MSDAFSRGVTLDDSYYKAEQLKAGLSIIDGAARASDREAGELTEEEMERFGREVGHPSEARIMRFVKFYESFSPRHLTSILTT